ncbi:MAG: SpoIIE family protein phosphatase [Ignavibacteria bacterium]|nr:SpoIIE family protein phosphatase [Ignavibacteria bacterium]
MSIKILVVDDEPDLELLVRQRFRKKIQQQDYQFLFAPNGVEALTVLDRERDVEIVLSDINMPQMDGLTLLNRLREAPVNPIMKSIIVSAYGDLENIRTAMNRGAFDFVTKPIDFNDLEITIEKTRDLQSMLKLAQSEREQLVAIQHELTVARRIQQSILPKQIPPQTNGQEFGLHANMIAAKEVGGDFYDFFMIDPRRLGFVIGDVSGKGVPAAIFMAMSRTIIRATALRGLPPGECLTIVNGLLAEDSDSAMFVTVFYGVLHLDTGEMEFTNAGHNIPYVLHADGSLEPIPGTNGLVLGIIEGVSYEQARMHLLPGDSVFLFTDGVTEAMEVDGGMYGEERLEALLPSLGSTQPELLVQGVFDDVRLYATGAPQSDDITCLALRYRS